MAHFHVDIDKKFIDQLNQLGERSETAIRLMLDDAGQSLGDALENEIRSKHTDTGELADSIEVSESKPGKDGVWRVWAYPAGSSSKKRTKGKVYSRSKSGTMSSGKKLYNSDKLFFLECGTSKQPARPLIDRVVNNVSAKIKQNMQRIFEREMMRK